MGLAILSRDLLRRTRPDWVSAGWRQNCATTAVTLLMHFYSGVITASGVVQGACGRHALFERTPKQGAMQEPLAGRAGAARGGG